MPVTGLRQTFSSFSTGMKAVLLPAAASAGATGAYWPLSNAEPTG